MLAYLITFLLGAFTGAAGTYFGNKYTDKRRAQESNSTSKKCFEEAASKMPKLIEEMQQDLVNPENAHLREFYVLPNDRVLFNSGGRRYLCYFEAKHRDLLHKLRILEDYGYIQEVTHTDTPMFRMTEAFVSFVVKAKIKSDIVKV
jgi:hypothetical protein